MDAEHRIDTALERSLDAATGTGCPPKLAEAIRYAVVPGGHRIRPRLCLAVAMAHGDPAPRVTDAALAGVEFLHCASLVHDDMPCFDDAPLRRGKPSLHAAYGQALALLCGDALIVAAFQALSRVAGEAPAHVGRLLAILGDGVGTPDGIVAGQAYECEDTIPLTDYQRAKTGALFAAATQAGAAAAGVDHRPWARLGARIGEAYQIADDILDCCGDPDVVGKPVGQDSLFDRPNAVVELGVDGAAQRLRGTLDDAVASIPSCPGERALRGLIRSEADRFMAAALKGRAAA